jgi:hypothetical protein
MKRFFFLSVLALSMSVVVFGTAQAGPKQGSGTNQSTSSSTTTAVGSVAVGGNIASG